MFAKKIDTIRGFLRGRITVLSAVWHHPVNRGSQFKAVRDYLLWNAVRFTMDARHLVRLPGGIEIILGRKENYGSAVYTHGVSDFAEMLFLAHLLRKEDMFFDVGANVGMYSLWVSDITGAATQAFEPVPETFATLTKNIRLNDLDALIHPHMVAAGDKEGEVPMAADRGGLSHIVENAGGNAIQVPVRRLDDMAGPHTPYAMKMDVEGFEMHALAGAAKLLANSGLKAILIELQDWTLRKYGTSEQAVRDLLKNAGFISYAYDPFTRKLTPNAEKTGLNEIFIRPDEDMKRRLETGLKIPLPGYPYGV